MKRLQSAKTDDVDLEVIECDCGFHIGVDVSYLLQVGDVKIQCPSCDIIVDTSVVCPEVAKTLDEHYFLNEEDAVDAIEEVLRGSDMEFIHNIFQKVVSPDAVFLEAEDMIQTPFHKG